MGRGCYRAGEPGLVPRHRYLLFLRSVYSLKPLQTEASRSRKGKEGKKFKETGRTKKSKDNEQAKKSMDTDDTKKFKKADRSKKFTSIRALMKPPPVTLFLGLEDMSEVSPEIVPDLAPCWSHFIYVAQSRDIPLDPKDVRCTILGILGDEFNVA